MSSSSPQSQSSSTTTSSSSESSAVSSSGGGRRKNNSKNIKNRHILSAKYIEGHENKNDLVSRLRKVVRVLRDDETIDPSDSIHFPGLPSLCEALMPCVTHRDKQVRLYSVAASMELFAICAPDAPWSFENTLEIFRQTIRQLANLAHTTSSTQTNYGEYFRILELLAQVKIGVLLVEIMKGGDDDEDEEVTNISDTNGAAALQVLCELFRTLLQSVRKNHPTEIGDMVQLTVCGILEEFMESALIPIPLLDEILICIGLGPTVLVTDPQQAAKLSKRNRHKNLPLHQVEQSNVSYMLASGIIKKSNDRLSTPIASLLNGLLNNNERTTSESSILTQPTSSDALAKPQQQNQLLQADVWSIIYELHKIEPSILTTVIGNLSHFLSLPDINQREVVIKLLGRLFVKSPKIALHYRRCYREWLDRSRDSAVQIRLVMVDYLLQLVPSEQTEISDDAQERLSVRLGDDTLEVRLKCVHGLCDVAYKHRTAISMPLWTLLGTRLSSKSRQERKDALTGLGQIYYRHYTAYYVKEVEAGGDDCPVEFVRDALRSDDGNRYSWIPSQLLLTASFKDDGELRSRLWQVIDELLLGSELPSSNKRLVASARAVGLALLLDKLEPKSMSWLKQLFQERAMLQTVLGQYIDARAKCQALTTGSEEYLAANAHAQTLLERVAGLTSLQLTPGEFHPTLQKFHQQKDKHIFRILSTITNPAHTNKSRVRALEELPKRVKMEWSKVLVRRCAMGDFLNTEVVHHSLLLAQECFDEGDVEGCKKLLVGVEIAADIFPALCAQEETFEVLLELFVGCQSKKTESDLLTKLSVIISKAAPCNDGEEIDEKLKSFLFNLACRGTPEQARRAVSTMVSLVGGSEAFEPLLQSLTVPSRLKDDEKLVSIFAALAELAECAPEAMVSPRGQNVVSFAMEKILLGRAYASDSDDDSDMTDSENTGIGNQNKMETPVHRRQRKGKQGNKDGDRKHLSPNGEIAFFEDETLSLSCRTTCAAIEFLASYLRSATLASRGGTRHSNNLERMQLHPELKLIDKFFEAMCRILQNQGMPLNEKYRRERLMRQDRSAIRTTIAVWLLRLCDARLVLDNKFLTPGRWHTLSGVLLDDEKVCRDTVMSELSLMLTGNGKFKSSENVGKAVVPNLRFFAFLVFCVDGEHGAANGNAASVGKRCQLTKSNAMESVKDLRRAYEESSAQARASGPEAEKAFESRMKTALMPEYAVPYALHLLSFRNETPSSSDGYEEDDASGHKMLRKRMKCLFDPLVQSLGDSADNISFLLRMMEMFGKNFEPILDTERTSMRSTSHGRESGKAASRLQVVCSTAREVLLSYVKKDVNLTVHPGNVIAPGKLFRRKPGSIGIQGVARRMRAQTRKRTASHGSDDDEESAKKSTRSGSSLEAHSPQRAVGSSPSSIRVAKQDGKKSKASLSTLPRSPDMSPALRSTHSRVHFSPEVSFKGIDNRSETETVLFDGLSPIRQKQSLDGGQDLLLSSGEKTRGTTPPSIVRNTKFSSSMGFEVVSESPISDEGSGALSTKDVSRGAAGGKAKVQTTPGSSKKGRLPVARRKKSSSGLDGPSPKRRKVSVPNQINIIQKKPEPKRNTRSAKISAADEDSLDFESSASLRRGSKTLALLGKENQRATKKKNIGRSEISGSRPKRAAKRK